MDLQAADLVLYVVGHYHVESWTNSFGGAIVLPSSLCVEHYRILVDLCNHRIKTAFKPTGLDFDRGTENKSYFR